MAPAKSRPGRIVTPAAGNARAGARIDRLLAIWPLLFSYLLVASLYVWQASKHPTPWLFSDEIEYAQIARAIAETGVPARRGLEYWGAGLFPWLIAPFWWFDNLGTAYSAVKYFNALVMTAAMFPTYALARMLVPRPYAFLAAIGSVIGPGFIYTAMVMQEPVAYFAAATGFYVAVRALVAPTRWSITAAVAVAVVVPFVRDELIVVPAVMVGAVAIRFVCFGAGRAALGRASAGRRAAAAGAGAIAFVLAVAVARAGSTQVRVALESPGTMLDQTLWGWGALIVGLGVLPVVIGVALVAPGKGVERTRPLVAFSAVLAAALVLVTAYLAVKGAYQAATFEARVEERNLIYIDPLLFVALALFAATRSIRPLALAVAAALGSWAVAAVPLGFGGAFAADAPGLAILSRLGADYDLGFAGARRLLYLLLALSVLVGLVPALFRSRRLAAVAVVGASVLAISWSLRAETAAADYSNDLSAQFDRGLPKPHGWIDEATGGRPVVYIGQKIADPNGVWSMEFWNRNVRAVWSLDATAPGPGPGLTPDILSTDGTLAGDLGYRYAVVDRSVAIAGEQIAARGDQRLMRIVPPPRLTESLAGVFSDGWMGSVKPAASVSADYNRFDAPAAPGTVYVTLSRKGFCGPKAPGRVLIEVGTLGLGLEKNGVIDRVTERRGWVVDSCAERTFPIATPGGPFHVKVTVAPPFQPATLAPGNYERRYFGGQVRIQFEPPA